MRLGLGTSMQTSPGDLQPALRTTTNGMGSHCRSHTSELTQQPCICVSSTSLCPGLNM